MSEQVVFTKDGYNALLDTDVNHYIMMSDKNTFKIIATGIVSFVISSSAGLVENTLAHGLTYTPLINGFMKVDTNEEAISSNQNFENISYTDVRFNSIGADATNLIFRVTNNKAAQITVYFRYYIFEIPL